MRRKVTALTAACALTLGVAFALATPALAADRTAVCSPGTTSATVSATGSSYTIEAGTGCSNVLCSVTSGTGLTVTVQGTSVPTGITGGSLTVGDVITVSASSSSASTATIQVLNGAFGFATSTQNITVQFAGNGGGGGGGGGSSSSSSATPVTETLSLSVAASGATCTGGNPTGYAGAWLTLPSADQCAQSGPTAKPGAKLLGWATSANFPIARAQAQIDKKWGVIDEVIDGTRMIFIPGGMATFVSGSNNLFPVWSI